jgi:glucosylceramidase
VTGWIDWNLVVNMDGGPSWVNNVCGAPIIVNKDADEFYKQPYYYGLGHFR